MRAIPQTLLRNGHAFCYIIHVSRSNLKVLDLSNNDITTLKAKDFPVGNNSKLQKLHLDGNPLSCDCDTRNGIRDLKTNVGIFTYHVFDEEKRECKCNGTTVSVQEFFDTNCADVSPCTPAVCFA